MQWLTYLVDKYYINKQEKRLSDIEERAEKERCKTCEILEKELSIAHERERRLLELLHPVQVGEEKEETEFIPINRSRFVPWHVKRQQLENKTKRDKNLATDDSIEKLEKELGVEHG